MLKKSLACNRFYLINGKKNVDGFIYRNTSLYNN